MAVILRFAFEHMQAEHGGSVYLRLSTRPIEQPERTHDRRTLAAAILAGAYWLREPAAGLASSRWSAWARSCPRCWRRPMSSATICPGSACWW